MTIPAYAPALVSKQTPELPGTVQRAPITRKASLTAIKAAVAARALPVLKAPLEAFQRRSSSMLGPTLSQEIVVEVSKGFDQGGPAYLNPDVPLRRHDTQEPAQKE